MADIIEVELFDDYEQRVFSALNMVTSNVSTPEQWLVDALGGGQRSSAGTVVNVDAVLGIPAAWRSINYLAGHIAVMPKEVRQWRSREREGSDPLWESPVYRVCNKKVNDLYTPSVFWQTMMTRAILLGNAYAFISRDGNGEPRKMTILDANAYTVLADGQKRVVVYFTTDLYNNTLSPELARDLEPYGNSSGIVGGGGTQYIIPDAEVFHLYGLAYNGLWGLPLINLAKDTFGVDLAGLESVSYAFQNGGRPGLLLTAPRGLFRTEQEAAQFMAQFRQSHSGSANTGRTGLLREGMTATTLDASPIDSGITDLRNMSQDEIALLFGTEYLMGKSAAVYKDQQSRQSAYVTNTLNPQWIEPIECEMERKLLTEQQIRRGQFAHLDPRELMRGSLNDMAAYSSSLRSQGLISGNEGRRMHHINPVPELEDDYGNPNTSSPDSEAAEPEPQPEPEPQEQEEPEAISVVQFRNALAYNFRSLIEHESRRLSAMSKDEPSKFIAKTDKFYDTHRKKLAEVCRDLEIEETRADEYIDRSKARITEILGCTDPSQVATEVANMVSDWQERCSEFVA